jgi:hypothetical protein
MGPTEGIRREATRAEPQAPEVAVGLAWLAVWLLRTTAALILLAPPAALLWWLAG